jgi:NADH-quinone oxidoreductase subunit L
MEGPTPVSALIHAATMVTAGVFMIVRMAPLFECAPAVLQVITCLGAVTALFAASVGLVQKDIKRIIAYSTCSQLGYMFFAIGVSSYAAALFHLVTHAFFKALLFLGAGSVIHAMSDEQDITRMGGVARRIPATYIFMWIGSLALAGMPGFAGYYSKDWILESAWSAPHEVGKIAYTLGILSAFATAFYSWRLLYLVFHGPSRADEKVSAHVHESGGFMLFPLAILALGAIFSGYLLHDFFQNLSLSSSLIPHTLPTWVTLLPTVAGIAGILLATLCYIAFPTLPTRIVSRLRGIHTFLYNKWYVDEIYQLILLKPFAKIAYFLWHRIDQQVIDNGGPNATTRIIHQWSKRVSRAHTGHLAHAAIVICSGLIVFISLCYWYKAT